KPPSSVPDRIPCGVLLYARGELVVSGYIVGIVADVPYDFLERGNGARHSSLHRFLRMPSSITKITSVCKWGIFAGNTESFFEDERLGLRAKFLQRRHYVGHHLVGTADIEMPAEVAHVLLEEF